ncbi:MAG: hypothetical protein AAGA65_09195 [Actinomycetota bacterium]
MSKRIAVDFNMYDDGCFIAVTDETLKPNELIVAYDQEDHEMVGVVRAVDGRRVFFTEADIIPPTPITDHDEPLMCGWSVHQAAGWAVALGTGNSVRVTNNRTEQTVDA